MKLHFIKETCIYVSDLDRSIQFYRDLLGLELFSHVGGSHAFFRVGKTLLLCYNPESTKNKKSLPPHYAEGNQHFAFETAVEEYEKWKAYLMEKGIEIEHEHEWRKGLKSLYFRDPDNHSVEIVQKGIWGD